MVAAILATLLILAPVALAADAEYDYPENGEDPVATFSADDPDADAPAPEWALSGPDAEFFEISDEGVLTFEDPPDFETAKDNDEDDESSGDQGAGDNVYMVTVETNGGTLDVAVTVTNVNEPGTVTFTQLQAQATRPLMAEYDDDDNPEDPTWQWSRGPSAEGPWTEIDGATSADRSPTDDDNGSWLLATVSYTDTFGAQTASEAIGPVVDETLANAAPSFSGLDEDEDDSNGVGIELEFDENADGNIGDPLTATDADGDPRLYTITGGLDADCFGIGETSGQLSLSAERDFETPATACKTGGTARTADADDEDDRTEDGTEDYVVEITATDPTGATGVATVTVSIQDVNEPAEFETAAEADENITLYIDENETLADNAPELLALRQNEVDAGETAATDDTNTNAAAYTATDEDDDTTLDDSDQIRYSVEGTDAEHFTIGATDGELGFASGDDKLGAEGADFEDQSSYSITIVATSGGTEDTTGTDPVPERTVDGEDRTRYTTLAVTIKVVDQEDDGEVKISAPEPQEGKSVLATLSDEDGGVTGVSWQWSRRAALAADNFNDPEDTDIDPDPVKACADIGEDVAGVAWTNITDATSPIYTPDSYTFNHDAVDDPDGNTAEVGYCLRATATYTDDIETPDDADTAEVDESKDMAEMTPTRAVQRDDPANAAPEFNEDQDPNTPGDQAVAERSVAENTEGKVGEPVVADDSDLLMYSVDDTDNFKVDNDGQISTAVELDYETQSEYMVTLTATDPSGASDTIMVRITVTNENDDAMITGMKAIPYEENDDAPVATFSARDPDADAGDPEWELSGPDAEFFEISDDGVLTFEDPPDFEDPKDNDEDGDTSGDQGAGDNVYMVTVEANGGTLDVAVTVTNLNEPGSVTFTQVQAQATRPLMAEYDDDDKAKDPTWQWSSGPSAEGPWTEIDGATSSDRDPTDDDIGSWLLATVSYTDSFGAQTASEAIGPVAGETLSNAAPSFSALDDDEDTAGVQIELEFDENADGNIGDPLTATDADGDPRLYTITGGLDADCFGIGETSGQLSLSAERDFETPATACKTGGTARTADADDEDDRTEDGTEDYVVEITATDPTGATGVATVTVSIQDVNEPAEFETAAEADENITLYIDENETLADNAPELLALRQNEVDAGETAATDDTNTNAAAYTATDEDDDTTLDDSDQIRYSVEGTDAEHFTIGATDGELGFASGDDKLGAEGADFEDQSSYSITIVATSGGTEDTTGTDPVPERTVDGEDRTRYTTLAVTIKVVDQEDDGEVKISAPEPQEGKSVLATLSDEDGGVTGVSWQWSRRAALAADNFNDPEDTDIDPDPVKACADIGEDVAGVAWTNITDATSPIYTPDSYTFNHDAVDDPDGNTAEVGYCLRATATYTDDIETPDDADTAEVDESKDMAEMTPTRAVQKDDPANTAPEFNEDQDPNTPGDQAVAERSVAENTEGKVGEPVVADDSDLLMYSVDDTDNFKVDNGGQISTAVELDYETQSEYMVTLTATDPSGASDTIMVRITVTNENDDAMITRNRAPVFDDGEMADREVAENSAAGTQVGDPVAATDEDEDENELTYELSGADAMYFEIDDMGQITVREGTMLDYESDKTTYMVTVTVDDGTGVHNARNSIAVTIMLTDVNDYSPMFAEGETGMREVAENSEAGTAVGPPLTATDGDGEDVTYKLGGDDAMYFDIDDMGQITVGEETMLDYESDKTMYMVTVTADDGTGADNATGSIAVTIMVTDVNDYSPMFESETAELMVAENTEAGMPVGDPVIATDGDGEDVTYSLGGDDAMYFDIDDMGQITVGEGTMLDYESDKKTYMVTVTADDGTGSDNATDSIAVTIMVTDVNDYSPMFDAETAELMVAENTEAGMPVGDPVIATDGDGEDVTYSLGGDDAMYFDIDDMGQITVGEGTVLDYESDKTMYMVTVTADDGTGADNATGSIAVTIMVTDVNDYSPMFDAETAELMVAENTEAGMPVGDPVIATDGDGEDVTYSLSGDDAMYFDIDDMGQITVGEGTVLDYDSDKTMYMVTVTADDGTGADNATGSIAVTIMVIDNTPPAFASDTAEVMVEENQEAGTAVGDPVTAFDVEGDTVTYSMESMYFEIDGEGQITTTMKLDYEAMASHTVTLTASNGEGSDSIEVTIMVIDNTPPAFPSATANRSVEENQEVGTAVGDPVTAFDVEGDTVTYLMESMYFEIDGEGQITTTMKLDYEAMASHTVTVTTSNGEGSDSIEVTIMVIDNTPPAFPSATANRNVEESQDAGTAVGDPVTASDAEGDTVTYSMESMYFGIDGEGQITTTMKLDYEAMASHTVTVTASNGEGSDSIEVTIRVIDNPPPAFPSATANRRVDENLYAGAAVGDPVAADDDAGDTVAYSIDGSDYFDIDTSTGQIMTTMKLDEEAMSSHSVTVTATDSGGETDSVRVAITVNDSQPGCDTVGDIGLVNDCEALLDSEDALGGSLNWADDTPMSGWDGVTMSGERVTAVKLNDQGLDGTIPAALGRLSELTSLNLRSNADLSGGIPGSLNYLSNLTVLNLHSNSHTGEIPDLSGTSLVELYLPGNELTGSVPAWLNTMADMTELWLWGNDLSGTLPDLSGMTSLDKLKLNGNTALTGIDATKLPGGLRWLIIGQTDIGENAPDLSGTSLTTLWMNETGLSGVIPVAGIPASLTSLNLKDNSLSGAIPDMSGLVNLVLLRLHRNELSGDMPGTMGDLESIEGIWIYDNELTGIAAGFANAADTLTHLYLSGNSFAEGTCLPGGLDMVANNDFAAADLTACSQ